MLTDIGEYIVGAYLKLRMDCDVVDYNVRPVGGGMKGLGEIDVVGFDHKTSGVVLCEVTTHIRGLQYASQSETVKRIRKKFQRMTAYAEENFRQFKNKQFMFWSPVVPRGYLTRELGGIKDLELIINGEYKRRVEELRTLAKQQHHDSRNPFFRMLQIVEHMRD